MRATSSGNGLSCLGPGTKVTLGVAVAVLVALGGIGGRYVTAQTTASSHFAAADIHHSAESLNANWVPRKEYDADRAFIRETLTEIKGDVKDLRRQMERR